MPGYPLAAVTGRVARRTLRPKTLRQIIGTRFVLGVCAQLGLFVLVAFGVAMADSNNSRLTALSDEQDSVGTVEESMLEQRAEVHDYLASGSNEFLKEYLDHHQEALDGLAGLEKQTAGEPRHRQVERLGVAIKKWQSWAEGIRHKGPTPGKAESASDLEEDSSLFIAFHDRLEETPQGLKPDLAAASHSASVGLQQSLAFSLAAVFGGSLVVGLVLIRLVRRMQKLGLNPLLRLVETAGLIAVRRQALVPYAERPDEIGQLARALEVLQNASAEREILVEQAPIGICKLEQSGKILSANSALHAMLGYPDQEMVGRDYADFLHPEDRRKDDEHLHELLEGRIDRYVTENRFLRADGSIIWSSAIVALQRSTGRPDTIMTIQEEITDRKRQQERAAGIQRNLLPQTTPELDGYELAAVCRPAQEVAGDFYDWELSEEGYLDLTLADVMGKGVGAALVMAVLRTALRSAPPDLGLADTVKLAANATVLGDDEGTFVTMFRARLDVRSGLLRYVDAGHGHCRIRRRNGDFETLSVRSMPVGVDLGGEFREGRVQLESGDTLVLYSDGLVESETATEDLARFAATVDGSEHASELVDGVMATMPLRPSDDITLVVLRRQPEDSPEGDLVGAGRPRLEVAGGPRSPRR